MDETRMPGGEDEAGGVTCENKPTLEEILASQPLNPLRQFEFRVLPLYESKPIE